MMMQLEMGSPLSNDGPGDDDTGSAMRPAPKLFGELLRRTASPVDTTRGLFDETGAAEGAADEFDTLEDPFAEPEPAGDGEELPLDTDLFTADEIAERIASYQKLYDWIRLESLRFGHIQNTDRFGLASRPNEPIEFMELDMSTGKPRYPGHGAISFTRDRVEESIFHHEGLVKYQRSFEETFLDPVLKPTQSDPGIELRRCHMSSRADDGVVQPRERFEAQGLVGRFPDVLVKDLLPPSLLLDGFAVGQLVLEGTLLGLGEGDGGLRVVEEQGPVQHLGGVDLLEQAGTLRVRFHHRVH